MKTNIKTSKTKGETLSSALSIESPNASEYNNNRRKDMRLFAECEEKFSSIEIKFILMQLNVGNMMGRKITKDNLLHIEQEFILKVISNAPVAEYGSLLKNIITLKLLNSI